MRQRKHSPRSQCLIVVSLPEAEATTAQARLDHELQLSRLHIITVFDGDEVEPAASIRVKAAFRLAIVVEEKTDAAFKRRLYEHLKGLWRNKHLESDVRLSGDMAYTGTLPSALNPED
ncbi:unnamed protein product [Echinostoma caproni]|uniref:DUF1115 domain-containing protein n=1 Tax=Echinostoma caproni TaxID=27848 RepID=A0A183AVX0_9TREM|nr:unnamed protein product [Echinostoma caproni]